MVAKKKGKTRIVLLDTHAIIHRAYHALPDFSNSKGEPTGALFGVCTMLIKIIGELDPDYVIATYDLPGGTFRSEIDTTYKANRGKADDDLIQQINKSRDILEAFSIPLYEKKGFEADDILGTLAEILKKEKGNEIIIASGDMDTLQLVEKKQVLVYTLKKGISDTIMYDENQVQERFGFHSDLLPDYKGLRGDPSDNIVGIKGIGEKTATTLIQNFGTLEKMFKKLEKDEEAFLKVGIKPRIIGLLKDGEEDAMFSKTLATIVCDVDVDFKLPENKWHDSIEIDKIKKLFDELEFRNLINRVLPFFAKEIQEEEQDRKDGALGDVKEKDLVEASIYLWLLDSDKTNAELEDILVFTKKDNFQEAKDYLWKEIENKGLKNLYDNIEGPIIPIVKQMHDNGILIDQTELERLSVSFTKTVNDLQRKIYKEAGKEFNVKSPQQLSEILFDVLELPTKKVKKNKTGFYSTNASVLEKLKDEHEIISLITEHREVQKLLSTYVDSLPDLIGKDGKAHAYFVQNGTTTGRFSSHGPNMQNIPIRSEIGKLIRKVFIAGPGKKLMAFDYSQVELRVTAMLSEDEFMLETFNTGGDIHAAVAAKVFEVEEDKVTPEMRRRAKIINFGIIYGMGISALQKSLGSDRKEAQKFYDDYFEAFGSIKEYLESIKEFARKNGYTETLFGRRRYFPNINSKVPFLKAMAERMAVNAPIQGTATADIIKLAMIRVEERIKKEGLENEVKPILQIHDEIVYEASEEVVEKVMPIIEEEMRNVLDVAPESLKNKVPLEIHASVGNNLAELK